MSVTFIHPEQFAPGAPYHHVAVATGSTQIHVAGQVGSRGAASGDLSEQVAEALRNVGVALAAAETSFADVVRLTFYVVGWQPEMMQDFLGGVEQVAAGIGLALPLPPSSLIGVAALFDTHSLVEIEATAVRD